MSNDYVEINEVVEMVNRGELTIEECAFICDTSRENIIKNCASLGMYIDGCSGEINKMRREMGW